jgi:hypothetical protein
MTNQELKKALCGNILDSKDGHATKTKFDMIKAIYIYIYMYSAPLVYRPLFYRQPRLSPKFLSVLISPIKNTLLYCQTQLPPSATGFQTRKS